MAFAEVFGMPLRVGKHGTEATEAQKTALLSAVASMGTDAAAIIPEEMDIEFVETSKTTGGEKLFLGMADWFDGQTSKGVLGQTMTADDGASLSQAQVHNEVRGDIKIEDAKQLAATLRRDLVRPLVDLNFGPRPANEYPKVRFVTEEPEDLEKLAKSLPPFIKLGLRVQSSIILDRFGIAEAEEGAEVLGGGAAPKVEGEGEPDPGEPGEPEPGEPEPPEQETALERIQRETAIEMMAKIRRGEELTADQRGLLSHAMQQTALAAAQDEEDEIDRIAAEELKSWQRMMDPMLKPVMDLAKASTTYKEFLAGLDKVLSEMDTTVLGERLAIAQFKARGLGDGTDEV